MNPQRAYESLLGTDGKPLRGSREKRGNEAVANGPSKRKERILMATTKTNAIATFNSTTVLPSGTGVEEIKSKATGKTIGTRVFCGALSAAQIRQAGKESGLKGAALKRYVNEGLTNSESNRRVALAVATEGLFKAGFTPDVVDVKAKSATIKFTKVEAVKPPTVSAAVKAAEDKAAELARQLESIKAALMAKGATEEEVNSALGLTK